MTCRKSIHKIRLRRSSPTWLYAQLPVDSLVSSPMLEFNLPVCCYVCRCVQWCSTIITGVYRLTLLFSRSELLKQEAFEKCWAHSRLRSASRPLTRCRYQYCRALPAHQCPRRQRRQRRQRQRVTEGTAMAPCNGPNNSTGFLLNGVYGLNLPP